MFNPWTPESPKSPPTRFFYTKEPYFKVLYRFNTAIYHDLDILYSSNICCM